MTTLTRRHGIGADRATLKTGLDSLSAMTPAVFAGWSKSECRAFPINACKVFTVELSRIFDWHGADVRLGRRGIASLPAFAARHADRLADAPADRGRIRAGGLEIAFTDHDGTLNDLR